VRYTHADESCPNRFTGLPVWACDPILQFKLNPELDVLGQKLSRAGFRTHEFTPKRPAVYRILALGDSCTFGQLQRGELYGYVSNPYPLVLEKLLADRVGPGRFEVLNVGIPGYNSYQGLMLLRGKLRGLDPDLITVRFGWNDLFLSEAPPGQGPYRESDRAWVVALEDLALRTALYPFVRRLGFELRAWRGQSPDALRKAFARQTHWSPTIPLADFEHNLRRIVEIGRARGAKVWLLTEPYNTTPSASAGIRRLTTTSSRSRADGRARALQRGYAQRGSRARRAGDRHGSDLPGQPGRPPVRRERRAPPEPVGPSPGGGRALPGAGRSRHRHAEVRDRP
jgi:lysophospholipase L1-like esterase